MAEQHSLSENYENPFKFNGKELDEETGLYYYGARYYDPRVSVWLSVDPLTEKYPSFSPYIYCAENPIFYKDPDGRKIIIYYVHQGKERSYTYDYNNKRDLSKIPNNKFLKNTVRMLDKLIQTGATKDIIVKGDKVENCNDRILQIVSDPRQLSIVEIKDKKNVGTLYTSSTYKGENQRKEYGNNNGLGTIKVNDDFGIQINIDSGKYETNSPTAQLGHEFIHEEHFKNDVDRYNNDRKGNPPGGNAEERLTTAEANQINSRLDEPTRNDYSGKLVEMSDPTINKEKK